MHADKAHERPVAMGYMGSERTTWRALFRPPERPGWMSGSGRGRMVRALTATRKPVTDAAFGAETKPLAYITGRACERKIWCLDVLVLYFAPARVCAIRWSTGAQKEWRGVTLCGKGPGERT
jgi:hypothetical protein